MSDRLLLEAIRTIRYHQSFAADLPFVRQPRPIGILMKFDIHDTVAGGRLRDLLPPEFRGHVPALIRNDGLYTLAVFSEDVVRERTVRKALEQIDNAPVGLIVAAGRNFTREARDLLLGRSAVLVARGDFEWTEASYEAVR
jgi:hypothetical protein